MHVRERFNEIPSTARQSFFNQSLVRFPQILLSTDIGEAQVRQHRIAIEQPKREPVEKHPHGAEVLSRRAEEVAQCPSESVLLHPMEEVEIVQLEVGVGVEPENEDQ
jgi:hypothetical protein